MNFAEDFELYKQNVTPPMLEVLASDLGCSIASLQTLGVGFYPAKQAWVFAERDSDGDIIGLALRGLDGKKFMVEGSKRGLIYLYNEDHLEGEKKYDPGRCHWVRIGDAGVNCPVCGKPDWCLISSDDPNDPSAALCSRIKDGSVREISGVGYLHLRGSERYGRGVSGSNRSTLCETELPILVVEGASDVLAAMDLGFMAIGKPSAKGGMTVLREMPLAGKEVWILGENDAGAGKDGMEKTFVNLTDITDKLVSVMPPEGVKDLRQWVNHGLTQESLFAYIGQYGHTASDDPNIFPNDVARTIAKRFLKQFEYEGIRTLRRHCSKWAEWNAGKYEYIDSDELRGRLYRYLDGKQYVHETKDEIKISPYKPTKAKIGDIIDALNGEYAVVGEAPVWTEQRNRPETRSLIAFKNGILDVNKFCEGKIVMLDPTPELFTVATLPYAYDPASWSTLLDGYNDATFGGDEESIRLLAQWFGYNAVYDMSYEKFMIYIGPTRSGKSTILAAMSAMLGKEQCGTTSLSALANTFGLAPLIGKSAVIAGDVKGTLRRAEMDAALESILKITGRDKLLINPKYGQQYEAELKCRFTMAMNDLPVFCDNSKAIVARALVLPFPNSYVGKEDFTLKDRLKAEAKAGKLINFALWGLKDLRKTGRFAEPESARIEKQQLIELTAPVMAFTEECCLMSRDVNISKDQLYEAFKVWCDDNGRKSGSKIQFGRWVKQELPTVTTISRTVANERERHYKGVTLSNSAYAKLLERPS
jgi:putative DNA primase/helicase